MYEENILFQILYKKNMTYQELSRLSGISVSSLNRIANYYSDPRQSTMISISRALDMDVVDVFNLDWRNSDYERWR